MKLRRRDPHQPFIAEAYYTLKHDGSDQVLKKIRTIASLNTLTSQSIQKIKTNQTQTIRTRTIQNKQSRLNKLSKKHQSSKVLTPTNQVTNVNQFQHLTAVHYMDTAQIKWAFGLRHHQQYKCKRSISQVPNTYYKTTQSAKNHHQTSQVSPHVNFNMFAHLTKQGQHPSMGLLKFETSLRENQEQTRRKSPQLLQKQRSFMTIPLKDRHDYPKLLNSQSLKKKAINPQKDMQTAFDGANNYPLYTNRIIKDRNYNNLRQHLKKAPRSKINLPSLGWQTNLRFYRSQIQKDINRKDN